MKISAILSSLIVVSCSAIDRNLRQQRALHEEERCSNWIGDDDWALLAGHAFGVRSEGGETDACAMPKDATSIQRGKVFMDNCEWDSGGGWRVQTTEDCNSFLIHAGDSPRYVEDPPSLCMQAGLDTSIEDVNGERATIRLMPCDIDSPLQRFIMKEGESSPIKLQANHDLCLTWNSANDPILGTTHLIVMPCQDLKRDRAEGWYWL